MITSISAPKRGHFSREGEYAIREAIISNISHRSHPKYFVLLYQAIKEKVKYMNITIEKKTVKKNGAFVTIQL